MSAQVYASELRVGDVLARGGTITAASLHPSGWVVVEVDWATQVRWRADELVPIHERNTR